MFPYYTLTAFNIGPLTLHTWGLFAGLAFAVALFIALKEAKRKNINEDRILDLAILIIIGGVVGARGAYVLENWDYFSQNSGEILSLKEGGLMFLGGALAVVLFVGIYIKRKKFNGWNIIDALVPSFAIGEFIGRIGCALSDLHIGTLTTLPWAQEYIDGSARHPISIYMSINGLAMFIIFWFLRKKIKIEGALFMLFVLWYSGIRFLLDYLRCSDLELCDPRYSGYTPSQYISAGIFIISSIYLINIFNNSPNGGKKHMPEQKKDDGLKTNGNANENKDLQGSAVSITEVEEIVYESNTNDKASDLGSADGKTWKNKLSAAVKTPWVLTVMLFIVSILLVHQTIALVNYDNFFKKSPFVFQGKTWISTDRPIVGLKIVNDKNCEKCDTSKFIAQIKDEVIPTLSVREIDFNSEEGKKLTDSFKVKSLPAMFFDIGIEKSAIFINNINFKNALKNKDSLYYLSGGIQPGKFLELPVITAEDHFIGPKAAPITIIGYSDFSNPNDKEENIIVKRVLEVYPEKVRLVVKNLPSVQLESQSAAETAECAGDQGKFFEMADALYANQTKLDAVSIAKYAKDMKLDAKKFKECVDSGKFKAKIANDSKIANEFGVGGTPAFFVGNELVSGAISPEEFKKIIDAQLAK